MENVKKVIIALFGYIYFLQGMCIIIMHTAIWTVRPDFQYALSTGTGIALLCTAIGLFRLKELARKITIILNIFFLINTWLSIFSMYKIVSTGNGWLWAIWHNICFILPIYFFTRPGIKEQFRINPASTQFPGPAPAADPLDTNEGQKPISAWLSLVFLILPFAVVIPYWLLSPSPKINFFSVLFIIFIFTSSIIAAISFIMIAFIRKEKPLRFFRLVLWANIIVIGSIVANLYLAGQKTKEIEERVTREVENRDPVIIAFRKQKIVPLMVTYFDLACFEAEDKYPLDNQAIERKKKLALNAIINHIDRNDYTEYIFSRSHPESIFYIKTTYNGY